MVPTVLGRYRLDQQVGQGGMAVVWRGFDTQLRRTVAVKVLHPHLLAREEIRRRFSREAHAVARLHHPHILDIYDFSGPEATPSYLVTEFIPGASLRAFADAHPFDPPELAAACALSLADALEHAHAAGVVHRDLKPENVMVREDGLVKLTDFGIAALLDPDEKFTATGAILGSPAHLAPETIEGKPADPRSDLFSLGTVLYWLACGALPFQAKTPAALLRLILEGRPPDPRSLRPAVSDRLAQVIARLLERDPEKRIQTATEAKKELLALLAESGLDEPAKELALFVSGNPPEAAAQRLRARLVERSLSAGEEATRAHRTGAALAAYSRVLALEPANALAAKKVALIRQRARTIKRLKLAAGGLVLAASLAVCALELARLRREPPAPLPASAAPLAAASPTGPATDAAPAPSGPPSAADPRPSPLADARPPLREQPAPADPAADPAHDSGQGAQRRPPRRDAVADVHLPRRPLVPATLNVHWVWAHVFVDGVDLGESQTFNREFSAGPHKVTVSHLCCLDSTQTIDIEPGQTRYTLEPGKPRPARLALVGAPADAQVLIDGVAMGTSQNLTAHELPMTDRPSRDVLLTVGNRSSHVTLQAGRTNQIDYLQLAQGGAP